MPQRGPLSSFKSRQKFRSPIKIHNVISFSSKSQLIIANLQLKFFVYTTLKLYSKCLK